MMKPVSPIKKRAWASLTKNNKPIGKRQFCWLTLGFGLTNKISVSIDRDIKITAPKSGTYSVALFNAKQAGNVFLMIGPAMIIDKDAFAYLKRY